jgi:cobalt-precorrin-6B (C15)-methyltransferase
MKWLRDEEFIRGKIPMTKFEARVLILAMLDIGSGDVFADIGGGTGSIAIQAALLGAKVYAVEKEPEGIRLIIENADRFGVNIEIFHGTAPQALEEVPAFNKCFIGGSGGCLEAIAEAVDKKLPWGGLLGASFIVPDNMVQLKNKLKELEYKELELRMLQSAVLEQGGLMKGQNPIYLMKGKKQ